MCNPYENDKILGEYLLFHFGKEHQIMPWSFGPQNGCHFPLRTVDELVDFSSIPTQSSALDLGCAVGGSSFHLTHFFNKVTGLDYSTFFIEAANHLKAEGTLPYRFQLEGDRYEEGIAEISRNHESVIDFLTGDACNLPENIGVFDLVHAANLICRLESPIKLLERFHELVKPGGQLVLATPFTWLEEFTKKEHWLGSGNSAEVLQKYLEPHFLLEKKVELPFVIREHRRKFQFSVSFGTRWRRI
jgi:putative 4-mercaptohistidine N1-methyltranferase